MIEKLTFDHLSTGVTSNDAAFPLTTRLQPRMSTTTQTSTKRSICPQCRTQTTLANIRCPKCGVNLVLAVARAAREALSTFQADVGVPYEADKFLPRFGEFLLRQGDITSTQLDAALEYQKSGSGQYRTVGQILLEMGAVNREQLDQASLEQMKEAQVLLREAQGQVNAQATRIQQLESTLGDLAQLCASSVDMMEGATERLKTSIANLRSTDAALELSAPLIELDALAADLSRFTFRER